MRSSPWQHGFDFIADESLVFCADPTLEKEAANLGSSTRSINSYVCAMPLSSFHTDLYYCQVWDNLTDADLFCHKVLVTASLQGFDVPPRSIMPQHLHVHQPDKRLFEKSFIELGILQTRLQCLHLCTIQSLNLHSFPLRSSLTYIALLSSIGASSDCKLEINGHCTTQH